MDRTTIRIALSTILINSGEFKKVYTAQTDIKKENSFPIAWVLLGNEQEGQEGNLMNKQGRLINGIIRLGVKQDRGQDVINPLIDTIYDLIDDDPTLSGSCLKSTIKAISTSEGLIFPYEMAEILLEILIR